MIKLLISAHQDTTHLTPAPWRAWLEPIDQIWRIAHALPDKSIIVGWSGNEKDARLIAAAPELLEALLNLVPLAESAMKECGQYDISAELQEARAAIAKATKS
jgi:hypothetical protein